MKNKLLLIKNINAHMTEWSVKVLVYDKSQPRPSTTSSKIFQRLTLIDSEVCLYNNYVRA